MRTRFGRGRLVAALGMAAAACAAVTASPALAQDWQAAYVGQCCYMTLESGETATNSFEEKNVGTKTWYQAFVNLGTNGPHDRRSPFYNPADWIAADRATALDQPNVPPGQVGRFTFIVKAPQVQQQTGYQEHFEPVADGFAWMGGAVWLNYTVVPSQPPAVQITSAPASAEVGDPISVAASSTDNRVVDRVTFALGEQTETVRDANGGANTYAATLSSTGLEPGTHTITARAYDRAGNTSFSTATFSLQAHIDPPPPPRKSIKADVTLKGKPTRKGKPLNGLDLAILRVVAPQGSRIQLTCSKGACKSYTVRSTAKRTTVLTDQLKQFLKAGTRIDLRITHPEFLGMAVTYKIVKGNFKRSQHELK